MGKIYTLDNKLLCGSPEIRIGDKVYSIDDRKNTVKKVQKLFESSKNGDDFDSVDEALKLAFGKNYKEIEAMDMSFAAYQKLIELVLAAMMGTDPEEVEKEKSFPGEPDGDMV